MLPGEAVPKQNKVVMFKIELQTKGKQKVVRVKKTRWWKLNGAELREQCVQKGEEARRDRRKSDRRR